MEKPNDVLAVISHDVNDYKAWRNFFNSTENFRKANGILNSDVYQCRDDLNKIVVIQRFASMTDARPFLQILNGRKT